jgi:hypothetical protein
MKMLEVLFGTDSRNSYEYRQCYFLADVLFIYMKQTPYRDFWRKTKRNEPCLIHPVFPRLNNVLIIHVFITKTNKQDKQK